MNLFSDNFPLATTDEELGKIKKQYPAYDVHYVASGCIAERKKRFEKLWKLYEPYADRHFLTEAKIKFHQRSWEMYLANVFIKHGFKISSADEGPDIKVETSYGAVYVEAVAPNKGTSADKVPDMVYGVVGDVPENQMLMRLANSLSSKTEAYKRYLTKGVVDDKAPYVIAVNRADLSHIDGGMPLILKSVFGLGFLTFPRLRDINGKSVFDKPFWSHRKDVPKKQGAPVPVNLFEQPEYAAVSAVIYSDKYVLAHPKKLGSDCVLVHNPLAKNPLNDKCFPFFEQWKQGKSEIHIVKII
jgi:hypothetical protein